MDAIVYTSAAGHTKQYADLLSKKINLKAYDLKEAKTALSKGAGIIYMGWVRGGVVADYYKAKKRYDIKAVIAVGMGIEGEAVTEGIAQKSHVTEKAFYIQGGFDLNALRGRNRFIMNQFTKTMVKNLEEAKDLDEAQLNILKMCREGGNKVSIDRLSPVFDWYKTLQSAG